ncbi:5145_t:CDS:2, partial [Acaulospora colombiana]
ALSSIIVMCWNCPYSTFTNSEWQQVLDSNPYKITQPVLTDSLLTALYKATNDISLGLSCNFTLNCDDGLDEKTIDVLNNIKDEILLSKREDKHCIHYLAPFIKLLGGECTSLDLELDVGEDGNKEADFSCVVDGIPILNSEIKPLDYTQLMEDQDFVRVHLKGKKSINSLLEKGGPNKSIALLNM